MVVSACRLCCFIQSKMLSNLRQRAEPFISFERASGCEIRAAIDFKYVVQLQFHIHRQY